MKKLQADYFNKLWCEVLWEAQEQDSKNSSKEPEQGGLFARAWVEEYTTSEEDMLNLLLGTHFSELLKKESTV